MEDGLEGLQPCPTSGPLMEYNGLPCAPAAILSSWIDCIHSGTEPRQGPFSLRLLSSVHPITKTET